jgi:succinate dehydrogenase / fumarate reductase, cytochrome b subunit
VKQRPINLNFLTLRFPITAWVSIAHRLSGVLLIFLIPFLLWSLQESLASPERFQDLTQLFKKPLFKIVIWLFLCAFLYHWLAGIRHMLLELHLGESRVGGKRGAVFLIWVAIIGCVSLGAWLW